MKYRIVPSTLIVVGGLLLVGIILVLSVPSAGRASCLESWGNLRTCVEIGSIVRQVWINKYVYWQNPCPKEEIVTTEEGKRPTKEFMREVAFRNGDLFRQIPGFGGFTTGSYRSTGPSEYRTKGYGITVRVDPAVDRDLSDMPKCVEGVPVRYVLAHPPEPL